MGSDEEGKEIDLSFSTPTVRLAMAGKTKSTLPEIQPASALYIKLGKKGAWETECIFGNPPTLRIGYNDVSNELCITGRWKDVVKQRIYTVSDYKVLTPRNQYQS